MVEQVTLGELLRRSGVAHDLLAGDAGNADPFVSAVREDSRQVRPGDVFCCLAGLRYDGHEFAAAAADAGAAALVVQRPLDVALPQVLVPDVRGTLGPLALAREGMPQEHLELIGVTGTNGKTTVTHLLGAILEAQGRRCAVVGTLGGALTTPVAADLARILSTERAAGAEAAVLEVTSHALRQKRVEGLRFAAGAFTNLSPEHLDYHHTMEDYFAVKRSLFEAGRTRIPVVCTDSSWGRRLADDLGEGVRRCSAGDAEVLVATARYSRFRWQGLDMTLPLGGAVNVTNAVIAASLAQALGVGSQAIRAGLERPQRLPGRFEVMAESPVAVIVDFAHSPAALEQLLSAGRVLAPAHARLTVVFGCGGDRDPTKREAMGAIASRLADRVVVTSDNPRREDARRIAEQIMAGVPDSEARKAEIVLDRRRAIGTALEGADEGDVVIVAGKGHETVQIIGEEAFPFDDREVVRELLAAAEPQGVAGR